MNNLILEAYVYTFYFFFFNAGVSLFKHLHAKGRKDDLFSDPCYQQFGEELTQVLKDWQPSVLPDGRYCLIITISTIMLSTLKLKVFVLECKCI